MSKIQADEINSIIKERIDNFELNIDLESIKSERKTMKIAIVGSDMMSRNYGIEAAIEQVIAMGNNYPIEIIRLENDHKISGTKPTIVLYDDCEYSIRSSQKMRDLVVEQKLYIDDDLFKKENHPYGWYRKFEKKRF